MAAVSLAILEPHRKEKMRTNWVSCLVAVVGFGPSVGSVVVDTAVSEGVVRTFLAPGVAAAPITVLTETGSVGAESIVDRDSLSRRPSGCDNNTPMADWYLTVPTPGAAN